MHIYANLFFFLLLFSTHIHQLYSYHSYRGFASSCTHYLEMLLFYFSFFFFSIYPFSRSDSLALGVFALFIVGYDWIGLYRAHKGGTNDDGTTTSEIQFFDYYRWTFNMRFSF